MAKINRYDGDFKAFASGAIGTERTVFGDVTQSDTLDANINADFLQGWGILAVGGKPPKQWFNGALFTVSQTLAYLHQHGIAEWNTNQEYNTGSLCLIASTGIIYRSLSDSNTGNDPAVDTINWKNVLTSEDIIYDNSTSGLSAINIKAAIDELTAEKSDASVTTTLVTASDAAWEPSADVKEIEFTVIGAGGGGGGADGQGAGTSVSARGGNGGSFTIKRTATIDASYNIVIGAGGAGGNGTAGVTGNDGGNTSVTSTSLTLTAPGGKGGPGMVGTSGNFAGNTASLSAIGTGGDINGAGCMGSPAGVNGGKAASTGNSGFCPVLGGGVDAQAGSSALNARMPGEGGGASYENESSSNYPGGEGFDGVVIIKEFF